MSPGGRLGSGGNGGSWRCRGEMAGAHVGGKCVGGVSSLKAESLFVDIRVHSLTDRALSACSLQSHGARVEWRVNLEIIGIYLT